MFKKISSTIDEEGVDGLLLNQIPIDSDGCDLMLDASRVPVMEDLQITTTAGENTNISLTDIKGDSMIMVACWRGGIIVVVCHM